MFSKVLRGLNSRKNIIQNLYISKTHFSTASTYDVAKLHHTVYQASNSDSSRPPILILHGLLGQSGNWRGITNQKSLRDDHTIICADLRNHGLSSKIDSMNYEHTSHDVAALIESIGGPVVLVGHSLGGKIAAATALHYPHLISSLIIVDIMPTEYASDNSNLSNSENILKQCCSAPIGPGVTRKDVEAHLAKTITNQGTLMFIMTNLQATADGVEWKPDVHALLRHYNDVRTFDVTPGLRFDGPTALFYGTKERYVDPTVMEDIMDERFGNVEYFPFETGHLIHFEKPAEFSDTLSQFLFKNGL